MEDPQKKSVRLLLLHRLLGESVRGYKVRELSERLGVTERTIERDLGELQAPPYSLPLDKAGWLYRLDRARAIPLPPITLTRAQAAALYLGARLQQQHSGPLGPLAAGAVQKLAEALPAEMYRYLTRLAEAPAADPGAGAYGQVFADLVTGWIERRKVVCVHATLRGSVHEYSLAPYILEPSAIGSAIYVRGQCDSDSAGRLRTLKLDRIRVTRLTDEHFTATTADPLDTLATAWHIWGGDAPAVEVALRFSARVAARVRETAWHPSQEIAALPDGGCEWRAWVAETQEMLPWIRGWGAECEVLGPPNLRNALIREARRLARLYGVGGPEPARPAAPSADAPDASDDETARLRQTFRDFFGG